MNDLQFATVVIIINIWMASGKTDPLLRVIGVIVWAVILCAGLILRFVKD